MSKIIFTFIIFLCCFVTLYVIGMAVHFAFKTINQIKLGMMLELLAIILFSIYSGMSKTDIIVWAIYIVLYATYLKRINEIPKEFIGFKKIRESTETAEQCIFSYLVAAVFLLDARIQLLLPFSISHLERYIYVYIVIIFIFVVFLLKNELDMPYLIKDLIDKKEVITNEDILDFVDMHTSDKDSDSTVETYYKDVYFTLGDFVRIGVLEKDDQNKIFRKKK